MKLKHKFRSILTKTIAITLTISSLALVAQPASAATIGSPRKLTLSSSSPAGSNATTSYTFVYANATTGTIVKSWEAVICTTASGACSTPAGFANSSATISQPTNLGDAAGWTVNTATAGKLRMLDAGDATTPTGNATVTFNNVQNPTTANQSYYARIATYSDAAWTTGIDTGTVAASTTNLVTLNGTMPESLVFCTGATVTGTDCTTATSAAAISFNQLFSPTSTSTATSQMVASTNASTGYAITVAGNTLTSGGNTITAMGASAASAINTKQFGMNLMANTVATATPTTFGTAITPASSSAGGSTLQANPTAGYGTANNFKFVSGDIIANADFQTPGTSKPTDAQAYTASYIANVTGSQAAGAYTTTLTYVCTATF